MTIQTYEYGSGSGDEETKIGSSDEETEIYIYTATEESGSGDLLVGSEDSHTSLVHVSGSVPSQYDFTEDFVTKETNIVYPNFIPEYGSGDDDINYETEIIEGPHF